MSTCNYTEHSIQQCANEGDVARRTGKTASAVLTAFAFFLALLCGSQPAVAASGKALINGFRGNWTSGSNYLVNFLEITNISGSAVSVKVTLYKQDGTIITDDGSASTGNVTSSDPGTSYNDGLPTATVSFDLAARRTTYIEVHAPSSALVHGYGLIEWASGSQDAIAIMANGGSVAYNQAQAISWHVPYFINGGQPF